jgi:hypothetical protein
MKNSPKKPEPLTRWQQMYLQQNIFNKVFVRGWTNNEYPAIANTFSLVASFREHCELRTDYRKQA